MIPSGISEIGIGLGIVLLSGASLYIIEAVFNMSSTLQNRSINLIPYTASSTDKQISLQQDTTTFPNANPILPSSNERTGIEFSYGFFLEVDETTFNGTDDLHNVFYKGYPANPWPLQAPGVYIRGNVNTMRIILNNYTQPFNYVDIENIPIGKWFHVVLNFQNLKLEVHVNGKLAKTLPFTDMLPYLNYENITVFSNKVVTVNIPTVSNISFNGSMSGKISNLIYARYALSYGEIQNLFSQGPSTVTQATTTIDRPIYFADSWWANQ